MTTHKLVDSILSDLSIFNPNTAYSLSDIYDGVEKNAVLRPSDWGKEDNGDVKWKHEIRAILSKRSTSNNRTVTYHGQAKYSLS